MYRCLECGNYYLLPRRYIGYAGYLCNVGVQKEEDWYGCPECGCKASAIAYQCSVCGEYLTTGIRIKNGGDFICDRCYEEVNE